ncbi:MAG: hypothetical protein K2X01_01635 [Cyanobacteria bacterium]|nr:hypothetical protein [Cyanobacteriota bacterium]
MNIAFSGARPAAHFAAKNHLKKPHAQGQQPNQARQLDHKQAQYPTGAANGA